MTRTPIFRPLLVLSLSALTAVAGAQTPPPQTPPQLQRLEEPNEAPITVTSPHSTGRSVTEKREQGRVTEIKVQQGSNTYYVKPNNPTGTAQPGDAMGGANHGAQWQVMEFDLGGKKKKPIEEEAAAGAPPPPAPPAGAK